MPARGCARVRPQNAARAGGVLINNAVAIQLPFVGAPAPEGLQHGPPGTTTMRAARGASSGQDIHLST